MCQLQFCHPLSRKSHYIITTRQARHRGSQMLVLATSSKTFSKHDFDKPPRRWRQKMIQLDTNL